MTLFTPWKAGAVALAAAMATAAAPARSAELTEFSCGADTLHRFVEPLPVVFRKSGSTPTGKVFLAQTRLNARGPGAAVPVSVECVLDRSIMAKGTAIVAGRDMNAPVDGKYDLVVRCTTRRDDGRTGQWERNFTLPAGSSGSPFDDPGARARFDQIACRTALHSLRGAR